MSYSCDTEVKTDHGWKLIKDVDLEQDKILSVNSVSFEMEYVTPIKKSSSHFDGHLLHFANRNVNLLVTDDQKMWSQLAKNIKANWKFPVDGFKHRSSSKQHVTRSLMEFIGLWLEDGGWNTCLHRSYHSILIYQNEENEEYVLNLYKSLGFKQIDIRKNISGNHTYIVYSDHLWEILKPFGQLNTKCIPQEVLNLNLKYLEALAKGYENGVFHKQKPYYYSESKTFMENIQELFLKVYGHLWQIKAVPTRNKCKPLVRYRLIKNSGPNKYGKPEMIEYHGKVYSLELEKNGFMLIRRGNVAAWCGDSFNEAQYGN